MFNKTDNNGLKEVPTEEIVSYIRQLTDAMHMRSLEFLHYVDMCPPFVAVYVQMMNFPALCGRRIGEWKAASHHYDVDLIATVTRHLFECLVTLKYLQEGSFKDFQKRAEEMIQRDELDLVEASLKYMDPAVKVPPQNVAYHENLKAKNPPKHKKLFVLAEKVGLKDEYDQYYRLYCKYAHPSLFLLVGDQDTVYSSAVDRIILKRAAVYLEAFANEYEKFHLEVKRQIAKCQAASAAT